MAKSCTSKLSRSNSLIDPATLNWQKESDPTWLYGPLYVSNPDYKQTLPHESTLKPNNSKVKSILKSIQDEHWRVNMRYWSKCASESGKQSVRFNPNITEIQYIPNMPIASQSLLIDQDEDEDDDELNLFLTQFMSVVTHYLKSILFYMFAPRKTSNFSVIPFKKVSIIFQLQLFNYCISTVTFVTWFMYQTLLSIIYNTLANTRKHILSS